MWWRRRREQGRNKVDSRRVVRLFTRPSSLEGGRPEGTPLPLQEEETAQPVAPTLLIGLGETGIEVLRRVKATLEVEIEGPAGRVAMLGIFLEEGRGEQRPERWFPLGEEEVLTFAPRYASIGRTFPWWRPEFATSREAARLRGRMLWFWDQTVSGERRITTYIDAVRTQLALSSQERLQVLIFGALQAAEFAMVADLALWIRHQMLEQHLFNVTVFGIAMEDHRNGARQAAALQELRRYIAFPQQWMEDSSGRPVVWEKFLFDHVFLLSEKDVMSWAPGEARETIYTALVDVAVAFLDPKAAGAIRQTLSLVHRQASFYTIGGLHTWLWKPVARRRPTVAEVLQRVVGHRSTGNTTSGHRMSQRQWIEQFLTRRFLEIEGESGFNFKVLSEIEKKGSWRDPIILPTNFRDGFRWRMLLFLSELMNEQEVSLDEGLERAFQFVEALFNWWARLRRTLKAPANRKWAGALVSETDGVLEEIQTVKEAVDEWKTVWRRVGQFLKAQEDARQITQLTMPSVPVRHYFGDSGWLAVVKAEVVHLLRERLQWRWQEVRRGAPELVLVTILRRPELWSVKRAEEFAKCVVEETERLMEQQFRRQMDNATDFPFVTSDTFLESFAHYRVMSKKAQELLFLPEKVKEKAVSQATTRPFAILGWGFATRMMHIVLEGGITPQSLALWQDSISRFAPMESHYVFVQEQRFASLRHRLRDVPWSPWFVNLLAAEEVVQAMGIGFWYGWVRLQQDIAMERTKCLLVSPSGEVVKEVELGKGAGWKEAFTQAARGWWLDDFQWGEWAKALLSSMPAWLQDARELPWEERESIFQQRRAVLESLGRQGEDGQVLQAYLRALQEEEQFAVT